MSGPGFVFFSPKLTFLFRFSNSDICSPKTLWKNPEQTMCGLIISLFSRYTVSAFVLFYSSIPALFLSDLVSSSSFSFLSLLRSYSFLLLPLWSPVLFLLFVLVFSFFPSSPAWGFFSLFFPPSLLGFPVSLPSSSGPSSSGSFSSRSVCVPPLRFVRPLFSPLVVLLIGFPPPPPPSPGGRDQGVSLQFTSCITFDVLCSINHLLALYLWIESN